MAEGWLRSPVKPKTPPACACGLFSPSASTPDATSASSIPAKTTCEPASSNRLAQARPIPDEPPATTLTHSPS